MPHKSSRFRPWDNPWRRTATDSHTREVVVPESKPVHTGPPKGELLDTITVAKLVLLGKEYGHSARITDVQYLASYNWVEDASGKWSIAIPGKPPRWAPRTEETRLQEDAGLYPRDKNAFRHPAHPFEPAVLAMLQQSPGNLDNLDLVACSATVGRLLQFIQGEEGKSRMLVEYIDGVTFFTRREDDPKEVADGKAKGGYGHTFPEAYTKWDDDVQQSASHQRVIRYKFGVLDIAMRFEGDGFLPEHDLKAKNRPVKTVDSGTASLMSSLESLSVADKSDVEGQVPFNDAGEVIDQASVFELRTRAEIAKRQNIDIFSRIADRLWMTQVNWSILAYHRFGTFYPEDIEIQNVKDQVKGWEKDHKRSLSMLAALLRLIIVQVKAQPDQKIDVCYTHVGRLEIRKHLAEAPETMSSAVRQMWCDRKHSSS